MNILIASVIAALPLLPAVRSERITDAKLPAEGYRIRIGADGRADIEAADAAGRFYAEKTLAQLPKPHPACEIEDWPAYSWRGVLLDESRHFFGKDAVKRLLDRMADFKFNVLHWHLMDSQGNRFPLPEYPRMNTIGATRPSPDYQRWIHDEGFGTYGPFGYSPADIAEILAYAKARFIRVVPEVEIPGHSREVLLSYPEFFCGTSRQLSIACAFASGHVPDDVLCNTAVCLGNDDVIRFFEYCLDEVCRLFPDSDVIHIGGDECPRKNWKTCPKCQARIRSLGLKDEDGLQAWCTRHFVDYLAKKGRRALGWDEILQGGLAEGAWVMSWRGPEGGIAAAKSGHSVVMCPHLSCYLDYNQGLGESDPFRYPEWDKPPTILDLKKVYAFDPVAGIPAEARKYILGGQANNWAEYTPSEKALEWKLWPRACAMAEVLWCGGGSHTYEDFLGRLAPACARLKAQGVNVAPVPETTSSRRMNAKVIQPLFAMDPEGRAKSFEWQLGELEKCDESVDLVVLPEFSDVPGKDFSSADFYATVSNNSARLQAACAATARRCKAVVFVGVVEFTEFGPRNATFAYDTTGAHVGTYYKRHVTAGERDRRGIDVSYTREWSKPYLLEIDGVRYAFLTCYDFYFYEAFASIARYKPHVVIGCSHQRSDKLSVLEFLDSFCAYNTGAYLVRASVSMGEDSPVGGSSMIVAPDGRILANLRSRVGTASASFDPFAKYLKPAGYGNPPDTHPAYIEIGRRPWQYRPGGSAIVPFFFEAAPKRLCAHRGFSAVAPENSLAAFGSAVALGASEIEFDLWWTKDGEIVSLHDATLERVSDGEGKVYEKTYAELLKCDFGSKKGKHFAGLRILRFEEILAKLSCHVIMNIHLKSKGMEPWDEANLRKVIDAIDAYDARGHVYFMTNNGALQDQLARLAPDIPRCMGHDGKRPDQIVERAIRHGCRMVQLFKPHFDQSTVDRAHAAGLRCNVFYADDPEEAKRYLDMGIDTILTNDYLPIATATGLK